MLYLQSYVSRDERNSSAWLSLSYNGYLYNVTAGFMFQTLYTNVTTSSDLHKVSPTVREVKVMHMPPNPFIASAKKIRIDSSTGERNTHG